MKKIYIFLTQVMHYAQKLLFCELLVRILIILWPYQICFVLLLFIIVRYFSERFWPHHSQHTYVWSWNINSFTISWWWRWCMMCGKKNLTSLVYRSDGISKHTQKNIWHWKFVFFSKRRRKNKILSDKQALHYFLWLLIPSQRYNSRDRYRKRNHRATTNKKTFLFL